MDGAALKTDVETGPIAVSKEADAAETEAIAKALGFDMSELDVEDDETPEPSDEAAPPPPAKAPVEEDEDEDEEEGKTPAKKGAREDKKPAENDEQDDLNLDDEFGGTVAQDAHYAQAIKTLELDGWTAAELKALSTESVLKMGDKRAAEHAKIDRLLASKKAQDSALAKPAEKSTTDDDDAVLKLAEELGGDERARTRAREIVSAIRVPNNAVQARLDRIEAHQARSRLVDRFPQLAQSKEFGETFAQAKDLQAKGVARTLAGALQAAAKLRYADEQIDRAARRDAKVAKAKSAGVSMNAGQRGKELEPSREDATDSFLMRRLSGDMEGAERFRPYLNKPSSRKATD